MSLEQPSAPADTQANAFLPSTIPPLVFEDWNGINTSATRAGVDDKQSYWMDGFFPIDSRNLRTLYGVGTALYTAGVGRTIIFFTFYNIGAIPYAAVFLDNGSVVQVNVNTQATTTILPAATITTPTIVNVGTSQWGNQFLIIVAGQMDGYWLWDGSTLFTAGGVGPLITITNVGSGYTSAPAVVFSGGGGGGAAAIATILHGQVVGITLTNPGSGYSGADSAPSITLVGGLGPGGSQATITVQTRNGTISSSSLVAGGSNYGSPQVALSGGVQGTLVSASVTLGVTSGSITSATLVNVGAGYIYNPTITVAGVGGTGASLTLQNANGTVNNLSLIASGSGYNTGPIFALVNGGQAPTGAFAQGALSAAVSSPPGAITSVSITNVGAQYSAVPVVAITDPTTTATATATLMPFGVKGTWVETYQGHVWVGNGGTVYFTAPGSYTDFSTSTGGGNFTSGDSFLKVKYTMGINANGFLWLIGDSSVNYISGVQTSGTPITTTFSNQNADPEVGSPYPASVETFGRDVLFANDYGVHVVNGSNVVKISEPLDGVWNTVASFGGLQISSSKAVVFGKKCWMVLNRIVDPISGSTVNKLFLWFNKKWFPSAQDMTLAYIKHLEINSVITAYGTDGTTIKPLFNTASIGFQKVAQSKLWDTPGSLLLEKANTRFWAASIWNSTLTPNMIVSIDSERNASPYSTPTSTYTITGPITVGYSLTPPQAVGQRGVFTGMTIRTSSADMQLIASMIDAEPVGYRG